MLDTDVASRLLQGRISLDLRSTLAGSTFEITFVTVAELLMWTEIRPLGERRRRQLEAWLDLQPVLPPGRLVSESWARLTARSRQRGRPRPVNDTWIAACCVAYEVPLATLNRADFEDYERHDGLRLLPVR